MSRALVTPPGSLGAGAFAEVSTAVRVMASWILPNDGTLAARSTK